MIQGFKYVFFGRKEPQNRSVLWVRPAADHKTAEIYFWGNTGWCLCGDWSLVYNTVRSVAYDNDESTLTFTNHAGETLFTITLNNLNDAIVSSVAGGTFDTSALTLNFTNAAGETLFTIDTTEFYTGGDGVEVASNVISLTLDPQTDSHLSLSEAGLRLTGLSALEARMETAEGDIDSLEARMDSAETDVSQLEERMDTAETNITDLQARMETAEGDIDALETRMDTAESDIDALETVTETGLFADAEYDTDTTRINFYAKDGTLLDYIDASAFIKDGMIDSADLAINPDGYDEGAYLHLVFNTDAGKEDLYLDLSYFTDIYTGGDGIDIDDHLVVSVNEEWLGNTLAEDMVKYETNYTDALELGNLYVYGVLTPVIAPYATTDQLGVIQAGNGVAVDEDGVLTADIKYVNSTTIGLHTGTLYVGSTKYYAYTRYTTTDKAGVMISGNGLVTGDAGEVTVDVAYTASYDEGLQIGTVNVGSLSDAVYVPYGSTSQAGVLQVGDGLNVTSEGLISIDDDYIDGVIADNEIILAFKAVTEEALARSFTWDSEEGKIYLYAGNGTALASIDTTEFTKDGMLDNVELVETDASGEEGLYLKFTFNEDSGKDDIYVDIISLLNIYTGSYGVSIDGYSVTAVKSANSEDWLYIDETGIGITGIDDISARLTTAEEEIDALQETVAQHTTFINTNSNNITTLSNQITLLTSDISDLEDDVETLQGYYYSKLATRIYYDTSTNRVYLYSMDGTALSYIDASSFIIDGMLESVELTTTDDNGDTGTYIHFTFNTDAGKEDIYVNVASLIQTYTAGTGITITDYVIALDTDYINSITADSSAVTDLQERMTQAEADIDELQAETSEAMTEDELDALILEVEGETGYGMATAMGLTA